MNATMNINSTNFTTKEAIKNDLQRGIVQIVYTKLNSEVNDRRGTLNFDLIPEKDHPNGNGIPNGPLGYINYYDLTKNEWRKFHIDRLKECNLLFELATINEEYEFHTLRFKKLTYEVVSRVATEIFRTKKVLTTLSLKTELRAQNYWAEQKTVSTLMNKVFEKDETWDYKQQDGEAFRGYFIREEEVVTV